MDDRRAGVARVYARAMLDLAVETSSAETLLEELQEMSRLMESHAEISAYFSSPLVDASSRRETLERLLRGKASDLLVDAVQVMHRKGRLALLPAVADCYRREYQARAGLIDVTVRTAVPLSDAQREAIADAVHGITGKKANLLESVDPSVFGGMILRFEDEEIDASVRRQLDEALSRLRQRASREIRSPKSYFS